ncbi:MAG: hypothetical protein HFG27_05300 [Provencibacterium sp.]|nr:hypothetical protein [Provencibacterium sp.]
MIHEYEHVKTKKTGITGIVFDIRNTNGLYYLIESDIDNELFDCAEDELERVE